MTGGELTSGVGVGVGAGVTSGRVAIATVGGEVTAGVGVGVEVTVTEGEGERVGLAVIEGVGVARGGVATGVGAMAIGGC